MPADSPDGASASNPPIAPDDAVAPDDAGILDDAEIRRSLSRMAHEIVEENHGTGNLVVLGIQTRGVPLARRMAEQLNQIEQSTIPVGSLDITMYRDDLHRNPTRSVGQTDVPRDIDGKVIVLVDDVLFTGRTVVAALDALKDLGRPEQVKLAVLIDRGHRQVPIQPDHVGRVLRTSRRQRVTVELSETDGVDRVTVIEGTAP